MLISPNGSLVLLSSRGGGSAGPSWYGSSSWLSGQLGVWPLEVGFLSGKD